MALNPMYAEIGKSFAEQYYAVFDKTELRPGLVDFYSNESFMTFEGQPFQGREKISEKLQALGFQKIHRIITSIDSQPMYDGGILISVLGRLKTDDDQPHDFTQCFVLKPTDKGNFFVLHDNFRIAIHDSA